MSRPPPRFIDDYLSYLLARASHAVYKEFERTVNANGLTSLEWRVLATLSDGGAMPVGELAHEVIVKQPTLTKLVQRMSDAGWVASRADPGDARRTLVEATARGRDVVRRLTRAAKDHEALVLGSFGRDEVETLKKVLRALIERADQRP